MSLFVPDDNLAIKEISCSAAFKNTNTQKFKPRITLCWLRVLKNGTFSSPLNLIAQVLIKAQQSQMSTDTYA